MDNNCNYKCKPGHSRQFTHVSIVNRPCVKIPKWHCCRCRTFVTKPVSAMIDRIRTLLQARGLSPTQFADLIGVGRPVVSHILSGRNKASLEVVQKIIAAFPDVALPWLLTGTGSMLDEPAAPPAPAAGPAQDAPRPAPAVTMAAPAVAPGLLESVEPAARKSPKNQAGKPLAAASPAPRPFRRDAALAPVASPSPPPMVEPAPAVMAAPAVSAPAPDSSLSNRVVEPTSTPQPAAPIAPAAPAPAGAPSPAFPFGADKPIRRIVIFYRDGSFSDFQPEG